MEKECRFCKIGRGGLGEYGVVDSPFFSGKDYFSIVSIGAFLDDWTMIVIRRHENNLHNEYGKNEFAEYLNAHIDLVRQKHENSSKIIIFEHGANKCASLTACGTSHAHLHVIPFEDSILPEIKKEKKWITCKLMQVAKIVGDKEYLLYGEITGEQPDIEVYVHIIDKPESQYFRRVLAEKIGLIGDYSYKTDARTEESIKIRKKFEDG